MYMGGARKASTTFSTIKLIMYEHFSTVKGWNTKNKTRRKSLIFKVFGGFLCGLWCQIKMRPPSPHPKPNRSPADGIFAKKCRSKADFAPTWTVVPKKMRPPSPPPKPNRSPAGLERRSKKADGDFYKKSSAQSKLCSDVSFVDKKDSVPPRPQTRATLLVCSAHLQGKNPNVGQIHFRRVFRFFSLA